MTIQEAEEIKELFLSKAPNSYYHISPLMQISNTLINYSAYLFTGSEDSSMKIGGLSITTMIGPDSNGEIMVELFIHNDSYKFVDNPELCKEIIERFVKIKKVELGNMTFSFK